MARLDLLTDRVERLDQAISEYGSGAPATGVSGVDLYDERGGVPASTAAVRTS